ncbi:MAG: hypothetical protein EHM64_08600 [Ignavibacteriae bacterium]|nr:MAG: hypothetical protein EHM64_08600 [Ignavibacteriota bacterium]
MVREPMFILLIACGTLYLLLGDIEEAIMLLGFESVITTSPNACIRMMRTFAGAVVPVHGAVDTASLFGEAPVVLYGILILGEPQHVIYFGSVSFSCRHVESTKDLTRAMNDYILKPV